MKQTIKNVLLVAVLMLVATMSIASAEEAPAMYFVPADGTGNCGEETTVNLMFNTSVEVTGVQAQLEFDETCVNITNVDFTGSPWQPLETPGWGHYGSYVRLASRNTGGVDPGVHKVATITIDCIGCNCTSDINITDYMPAEMNVYNTTFTCINATEPEPDAVADIRIWNGSGSDTIPIVITNADNVGSIDVTLSYNTSVANITGVSDGDMEATFTNLEHVGDGWIRFGAYNVNETMSGNFTLLNVDFEPVGNVSSCPLILSVNTLTDDTAMNYMNYTTSNGTYSSSLNGDVNDDDVVDIADAMHIAKYVVGIDEFSTINEDAADVTGDGKIDIADAMYLAKHIVGITGFEELR